MLFPRVILVGDFEREPCTSFSGLMGSASALCHGMQWVYLPNPLADAFYSSGSRPGWLDLVLHDVSMLIYNYLYACLKMFDNKIHQPRIARRDRRILWP